MSSALLRSLAIGFATATLWTVGVVAVDVWADLNGYGVSAFAHLLPTRGAAWIAHFLVAAAFVGLAHLVLSRRGGSDAGAATWVMLVAGALLPLGLLLGWLRVPSSSERPHVLLISIDTLRADHLGCYGYGRDTSPWIDGLAARGVRFADATAQATATLTSHLSLFTSLLPPEFRITRDDPESWAQHLTRLTLPGRVVTLTEALRDAGYRTAAFTDGALVSPQYGLGQGFEAYFDARVAEEEGIARRIDVLLDWVDDEADDEPLFLFLHAFDVHDPYGAPAPFARSFSEHSSEEFAARNGFRPTVPMLRERRSRPSADELQEIRNLYDNGIRAVDAQLARLEAELTARGLWDELLVVVLSDHGEEFQEHGGWGHGPTVYRELVHVPLLMRFPGDRFAGRVVEQPVALLDLAPTLAEHLGLVRPVDWRGRSLASLARGEAESREASAIYSDTPNQRERVRAMRVGGWKLVRAAGGRVELFDPSTDPLDLHDLAAERPDVAAQLAASLEDWVGRLERSAPQLHAVPQPEGSASMREAQLEQLKRLGYLR